MKEKEAPNSRLVPLAIVVAGAFVALAVYFGAGSAPSGTLTGNGQTAGAAAAGVVAPVSSADHIQGDANAKVVVIEYSDLECPFCKAFHSTMRQIMNDYSGQSVAWVFRQFPIAQLHSKAPNEAAAAECAAEQGGNTAFFNFINTVFQTTNSNDSLDPAALPSIAGQIGLDVNAFNTCLSSGKYTQVIQADVAAALKTGAQGTPYTVVVSGGKSTEIIGNQPYQEVKNAIDGYLK